MTEETSNSQKQFGSNKQITIRVLRKDTRNLISYLLNPEKHIPSDKGFQRYVVFKAKYF